LDWIKQGLLCLDAEQHTMIDTWRNSGRFPALLIVLLLISDDAHSQYFSGKSKRLDSSADKCGRGRHRTQADVTRSGDGSCKHPQMSHRVEEKDVLGLMIAPLTAEDFFLQQSEGPWGMQPRQLRRSDPAFYSTIESQPFESIVDFLESCASLSASDQHVLPSGQLQNFHDISFVRGLGNTSEFFGSPGERIQPQQAAELFENNFTIILHDADKRHAVIASIADRLEEEFDLPVHADLYWSPPRAHAGPTRHREAEDCFILQLDGKQMWFVGGAPSSSAAAPGAPAVGEKRRALRSARHGTWGAVDMPLDERGQRVLLLRKGDALYIPRTFPHQASTNSSFMHEPSLHLAVYVAVEAVSWEAVLHRALASLDAQPHATRHGDVSIVEQKAKLDGCSAKHQLTLLGVAHWLVRGVGMTEPELRATFVVGKQYQEAHRRQQRTHAGAGPANGLRKAVQAVREALDASEERVVAALLAQEGVAQGVHGKSARSWSELAKGCPEAWRAMLRDRAAWAQLRHLLPLLVDQLETAAQGNEALLLDQLITWAWDDKEAGRRQRRRHAPVLAEPG